MMKLIQAAVALAIVAGVSSVTAQTGVVPQGNVGAQSIIAPMVDGEVRKVDKDQGKITLKHGPITNLEMPGMTMVFRVKDPAMLDKMKEGDKIRFTADKVGGMITITSIETVQGAIK